jgi:hypothetical protein
MVASRRSLPGQAQLYDYIRKAPVSKADEQKKGDLDAGFAKAAKIIEGRI